MSTNEQLAQALELLEQASDYTSGPQWSPSMTEEITAFVSANRSTEAGKYDEVLQPFLSLMECELHANASKGDRPGWLAMSREVALLEIYWHVAKLSAAVKNNDTPRIQEHSADVANMAMMVLDVCGALPLAAYRATPPQAEAAQPAGEPDCWAVLTPNGSKLVSPQEAKGQKGAYPLYTSPPQVQRAGLSEAEKRQMWLAATIELCSHENCYRRGIADAERHHGISPAGPGT